MMKALETVYAGVRFRSRLEARWAVYFDRMKIRWDYEPEGLQISNRLYAPDSPDTFGYLPDFWFPDFGCYGEVKGSLDRAGLWKVLNAAAVIEDECGEPGSPYLVIFGRLDPTHVPIATHFHKGDVQCSQWYANKRCHNPESVVIAFDAGYLFPYYHRRKDDEHYEKEAIRLLLDGWPATLTQTFMRGHIAAVDAARSERFGT